MRPSSTSKLRRRVVALALLALARAPAAHADFEPKITPGLLLDLRLQRPSQELITEDGGYGKGPAGRRGDASQGDLWRAEEVSLLAHAQLAAPVMASVHLQSVEGELLDVVEGFVRYRPVSTSRVRWGLKAGAFFPALSFENEGIAWSNLYTLTNSAANTWVAEEVRTIGLEAQLEIRGREWNTLLTLGPAFANDASGLALAYRGFVFNDRNVGMFGEVSVPGSPMRAPMEVRPFEEIDDRPGVVASLHAERRAATRLSLTYFDTRGDVSVLSPEGMRAWATRFWNLSAEQPLPGGLLLVSQLMAVEAYTAPLASPDIAIGTEFLTSSALLAWQPRRWELALRGEYFRQRDINATWPTRFGEVGFALTSAVSYHGFDHLRLTLEYLAVRADRDDRAERLVDDVVQVGVRAFF
ncbi:MAG: hypothetical protein AAFX85_06180 [Pseudomonadota bacterium]